MESSKPAAGRAAPGAKEISRWRGGWLLGPSPARRHRRPAPIATLLDKLADLEKAPRARAYTREGYDLDGFRAWIAAIGDPQRATPWIHIAGTKGKGSTAAIAESILRAAGLRTGLFTSPHIEHYGERFRVGGRAWTMPEFEAALARMEPLLDAKRRGELDAAHTQRTVFEVLTAMAFAEFRAAGVEAGVLEVGLGGRLDCTNVVDPAVAVVAPLGMDHTAVLGGTIEAIAAEKAGIIKPGRPVVVYDAAGELQARGRAVVLAAAMERGAPVLAPWPVERLGPEGFGERIAFEWAGARVEALLPLAGAHQAANAGLALAAADAFARARGFAIGADAARRGIEDARWAGRGEWIAGAQPPMVLDAAHCPTSAAALGRLLAERAALLPRPRLLLWAMQGDKDAEGFLGGLLGAAGRGFLDGCLAVRASGPRGAEPAALVGIAKAAGLEAEACASVAEAVDAARTRGAGCVVAAGSLYHLDASRRAAMGE